jgi:transposase
MTRAHILAATDQGVGDEQIMQVLGVSRVVLWRTCAAYQEGGLNYALHDLPRAGAPRRYMPEQEAEVVALVCEKPMPGRKRWTVRSLAEAAHARPKLGQVNRETVRRWLKNVLKAWRKAMWCIGKLTPEYRERMYGLCELYGREHNEQEPVVCVDEKSKQLLQPSRPDIGARPGCEGHEARQDYEYRHRGTCNAVGGDGVVADVAVGDEQDGCRNAGIVGCFSRF